MSDQPLLRRARASITRTLAWTAAAATAAGGLVVLTASPGGATVLPTVTVTDVSVNEGNAGTTEALVTFTLDTPAVGGEVVHVTTDDGTARLADLDYHPLNGDAIDFQAGTSVAQAMVLVRGDTFAEPTETFNVFITSSDNVNIVDDGAVVTIVNDDATPAGSPGSPGVKLPTVIASLTSSTTMTIPVFANSPGDVDCGVRIKIVNVSTDEDDFVGPLSTIDLVHPAGVGGTSFTLPIAANTPSETSETFDIHLIPTRIGEVTACLPAPAVGRGTIEPPGVTKRRISIAPASVDEGDTGTTPLTFAITADGALEQDCEYEVKAVSINDSGLVSGTSGPQVFDAGTSTDSVTLLVNGDTVVEPDGQLKVSLIVTEGQAACEPGDLTAVTGRVIDDDTPPPPPPAVCIAGDKVTVEWPGVVLGRPSNGFARWADADVQLPAGRWSVKLTSFDPTHPHAPGQSKERWAVKVYDAAGGLDGSTSSIADLATGSKYLTRSVGTVRVGDDGAVRVRAVHHLAGVNSSNWGSSQSVVPLKAVFTCLPA